MKKVIPIDKSKKSNRRCVNRKHWGERRQFTGYLWDPTFYCDTGHKGIEYWNCCSKFEWNPEKKYKEVHHEQQ